MADAETGVVFCAVDRPDGRANTFFLYELYRTRAGWEEHLQISVIADALRQFETLLAIPPKITFCQGAFVTGVGRS